MEARIGDSAHHPTASHGQPGTPPLQDRPHDRSACPAPYFASVTLADGVNIKELSEYLGHHDPGFTLQMYTHLLPSLYDRARRAFDRRLERIAARLTEQSRSRADQIADLETFDIDPDPR